MKNLSQRQDFVNRHTMGLPEEKCIIQIVTKDIDGEHILLCEWHPFDKNQYANTNIPAEGYLGTAKVIEGKYPGIGFHAWKQNDSEFFWYKINKSL